MPLIPSITQWCMRGTRKRIEHLKHFRNGKVGIALVDQILRPRSKVWFNFLKAVEVLPTGMERSGGSTLGFMQKLISGLLVVTFSMSLPYLTAETN